MEESITVQDVENLTSQSSNIPDPSNSSRLSFKQLIIIGGIIFLVLIIVGTSVFMLLSNQTKPKPTPTQPPTQLSPAGSSKIIEKYLTTQIERGQNFTIVSEGKSTNTTETKSYDCSSGVYKEHDVGKTDVSYEMIQVGHDYFMKDYSENIWWKALVDQPPGAPDICKPVSPEVKDQLVQSSLKAKFTPLGEEKCGSEICYKYNVENNGQTPSTIWFDEKDFLLRKIHSNSKTNGETIITYSYDPVVIESPTGDIRNMPDGETIPTFLYSLAQKAREVKQ